MLLGPRTLDRVELDHTRPTLARALSKQTSQHLMHALSPARNQQVVTPLYLFVQRSVLLISHRPNLPVAGCVCRSKEQ